MGNVHETEKRWSRAGEVVLWVVFYFWAVWIFNAFLPPKPDQTPFEVYLKNQIQEQNDDRARSGRDQQLEEGSLGQRHQSLQHQHRE